MEKNNEILVSLSDLIRTAKKGGSPLVRAKKAKDRNQNRKSNRIARKNRRLNLRRGKVAGKQ